MMNLFGQYVEMMGDMEFALYVGIFVFSAILFFGLLGKLAGTKAATDTAPKAKTPNLAPVAEKSVEPKAVLSAETFLSTVENKKTAGPVAEPKPEPAGKTATAVPAGAAPAEIKKDAGPAATKSAPVVNSLEGAMMWDGDSGKKKKSKTPAPPPAPPARVLPPGYVDPNVAAKEKESEKTVVLAPVAASAKTEQAPAAAGPTTPVAEPVVPPTPKESVPKPSKTESTIVTKAAAVPADAVGDGSDSKPPVDFHMYETLVRRIAGLESEVKKDPLYLDPLMRRVSLSEKKLEELNEKVKSPGLKTAGSETSALPAGAEAEIKMLREKVDRLQKLLEQLAEGPVGGAAP